MVTRSKPNSDVRDEILASIQKSLRRGQALESTIQEGLRIRMSAHGAHIQPKLGRNSAALFVKKLKAADAIVSEIQSVRSVAAAVSRFLEDNGLSPHIVTSSDPLIARIKWPKSIKAAQRVARPRDHTSVTSAVCGVAETGTVVLVSSNQTPTTLNFLPENHIVILRKSQILSHFEQAWQLLREKYPQWVRTVNLISAPSKTADVEQTIQLGVHGPRQLMVVLVGA